MAACLHQLRQAYLVMPATIPCHAETVRACTSVSNGSQLTCSPTCATFHVVLFNTRLCLQVVRAISGFAPKHLKHASLDSAVDLSFRLYKHESGNLSRVNLNDQLLEKAFSQQNDTIWESVQSPKIGAINK